MPPTRSPRQIRATNRNWALMDIRGTYSRMRRLQSQQLVPDSLTNRVIKACEALERAILSVKP